MNFSVTCNGKGYRFDPANGLDISIPLRFSGKRLLVYGAPEAVAAPFTTPVAEGGAVNCDSYTVIPHCHGTHTECIGHITAERQNVNEILTDNLIPARLITVTPQAGKIEQSAFDGVTLAPAVIIRTFPNPPDKTVRNWNESLPSSLTPEAATFLVANGVKHLLIDTPSIDPLEDEGRLAAHRAFWNNNEEGTITELIYVPDEIADGLYLLNLQVAPFEADAAPSRPLLYKLEET